MIAILAGFVVFFMAGVVWVLTVELWTGRAFEPDSFPLSAFAVLSSLALSWIVATRILERR